MEQVIKNERRGRRETWRKVSERHRKNGHTWIWRA